MNSVSSETDEADLSSLVHLPPVAAKRRGSSPLPVAIVVALLTIAIGFYLARSSPIPSVSPTTWQPLWWRGPPASASDTILSGAIQDLVRSSVQAYCTETRHPPHYALRANGGRVALSLTSGRTGFLTTREDDPNAAIDDDVRVGKCWAFHELPAQLGIRLPSMLHLSHVSVEHSPTEVPVDTRQAPRNMTLWGVVEGKDNTEILHSLIPAGNVSPRAPSIALGLVWVPLASFIYKIDIDLPVQTFPIRQPLRDSGLSFGIVALEVFDNWGSDTTCLYRLRVHGSPV